MIFPVAFLIITAVLVLAVLQTIGIVNLLGPKQNELTPQTSQGKNTNKQKSAKPNEIPPGNANPPQTHAGQPTTEPESPDKTSPIEPVIRENAHADGEFPDLLLPQPANNDKSGTTNTPPPANRQSPPPPTVTEPSPLAAATNTNSPDKSPPPKQKAGFLANKVIVQFLKARTLDERLALMSKSTRTREELEASSLSAALKPVKSWRMVEMVPPSEGENVIQYLYYVSFKDEDENRHRHRIVMQMVERPGVHPPRVHGDAFIDHYEKRFAQYAKTPHNKVTTFHCIAEARTADLAKNIPKKMRNSMIRLVIKTHPHGNAAFDAYLNKNSPLMKHIGPRKDIPFVQPRFCVLSFRWNTSNPELPYIELNDIITQGWER